MSNKHKMKYEEEKELIEVCLNCRKESCATGNCEVFKSERRKLKRLKERQEETAT